MMLSGQTVTVQLAPRGVKMFRGTLPERARQTRAIQVVVLENDASGLWVLNRRLEGDRMEVLLIKWDLIEGIIFDVMAAQPEERRPIGFR